ncbi:MAG TPA: PilZ domain-containing protein [Gemmataceae bacterium]|nr:PilZ domain-containing protein [Gemmataceae bacterium]
MRSQLQSPSLPSTVVAEHTYLQVPSQPEWIAPTVAYLTDRAVLCGACHEARSNKLQLALHEALTNSVIHGNLELSSDLKERCDNVFAEALAERAADPRYAARPVEVHFDYDGEHCRWTFTDQGKGFDVGRALARAAQPDPEAMLASGRGILLMRAFLDDLRYELGGRRAILTLARPSGAEKRATPRQALQRAVHIAPLRANGVVDWDAAYQAVAQNLSSGGMAILQSQLASSERILIGIDCQGEMLYVPAEVRHCQARGGDMVELGCRFQVPPAALKNGTSRAGMERDLDALLQQLSTGSVQPDERRAHPRVAYTVRITITIGRGHPPVIGFGRDLSRGGISFLTCTPLPLEDVILALPQHDREALRIRARIVRSHQLMSSIYDVGARFLDNADNPE